MEILINIVNLILGSLFGWYGKEWIERFSKSRLEKFNKMRKEILTTDNVHNWIFKYYAKELEDDLFYRVKVGDKSKIIPVLTKSEWRKIIGKYSNFSIVDNTPLDTPIDLRLIEHRKKLGKELWNDPLLILKKIDFDEKGLPVLTLQRGEYYQYITQSGRLENEMYKAIRKSKTKTHFRDRYAQSIDALSSGDLRGSGVGVHTLIAINSEEGYHFILQRRGETLYNNPGKIAGIPCFGCAPVDVEEDVFLFNLFKEIYEELYDQEEIIRKPNRLESTWFYQQDPIKSFIGLYKNESIDIENLGFCIDPILGELNLSLLVIIKDDDFINNELKRMKYNWEVRDTYKVNYKSERIMQWILNDETAAITSYSLNEARNYFQEYYP